MVSYNRDEIKNLQEFSKETAEELMKVRNKFKLVRDGNNVKADFMKTEFQSAVNDLLHLTSYFQKDVKVSQNPQKDKNHEEIISRYEKKIDEMKKELLLESKAKDEALTRVSALASQLLKPGNPDIADTSDRNRPTRLAEDFKNLYDDEWTDAFEYLTEEKKWMDIDATRFLYNLLQTCNDLAKTGLHDQYKRLESMATKPDIFNTKQSDAQNNIQPRQSSGSPQLAQNKQNNQEARDFSKTLGAKPRQSFRQEVFGAEAADSKSTVCHLEPQLMEFRKDIAIEVLGTVTPQALITRMKHHIKLPEDIQDVLQNNNVVKYIMKCFRICWLMGVQFPPMEIDFIHKKGKPFISELFKVYSRSGSKITEVIWPPLYLHRNGPLAGVGYADGDESK